MTINRRESAAILNNVGVLPPVDWPGPISSTRPWLISSATSSETVARVSRVSRAISARLICPADGPGNLRYQWIKGQINDIYERRDSITPRYTGQAGLKVMEILKLLPMTNCKACGYTTCMAFAAALREGETRLEDCPPLREEKYREQREKLQAYLESYGWRALDAE